MKPTREELAQAVDEVTWDALRAHLERGGLIVVARELDLVEAGIEDCRGRGSRHRRLDQGGEADEAFCGADRVLGRGPGKALSLSHCQPLRADPGKAGHPAVREGERA